MASALLGGGCGDPPVCQSQVFVAFAQTTIVADVDSVAPGVQTDIQLRSSLREGELVRLEVLTSEGAPVASVSAPVAADGSVTFQGVTVPERRIVLRAVGEGTCGEGRDEIAVDVLAGAGCALRLVPEPEPGGYYAPLGVLSTRTDPAPLTPGYQTTLVVATRPGWTTEVFQIAGHEQSLGVVTAGSDGLAALPISLADGELGFRATCRGAGTEAASRTTTVVVDTTPPVCGLVAPAPGTTITPSLDGNHDLGDGVQLAVLGRADGGDVAGEPVTLTVTGPGGELRTIPATNLDASGVTTAAVTLAPASTPAAFDFALTMRDRAGNTCRSTARYDVVYDGCDIAVSAPTAPVASDADGIGVNGSQVDITLAVAPACAGRTVTASCAGKAPTAIVEPDGRAVLRLDICATSPCQAQASCTFRVATASGVETETAATIAFDDQGPEVATTVVSPALACGAQVTPAVDLDPGTEGVQIAVRVTSPDAASRALEVTTAGGTSSSDATGDVTVTLAAGVNRLVGVGLDALGNRGESSCQVTLADLSVSFSPPAADGVIQRRDGSVAGGAITFPLCGTTSATGATVSLVIDGAAAVPATVTGTTWCRTVTLAESPPSHTVVAVATAGTSSGSATLVLRVDLTPPGRVTELVAVALDRQRIRLTWTAAADGAGPVAGYLLKSSPVPLSDATFDDAGTVVAVLPPGTPGSAQSFEVFPARTGVAQSFAIAALDAAGNRAVPALAGPVVPAFDQTGAILPINAAQGALGLGSALVHGRFNDDEIDDLAVAAPGQSVGAKARVGAVYVYFGGPLGISALPDLTITSDLAGARLGAGLTAVPGSTPERDDLVIGAPGADGGAGRIFVFRGGAGLGNGSRAVTTADREIRVSAVSPGWFAGGGLGSVLAAADVDGDGTTDLIASAPRGGNTGGAVILYGGTGAGDVELSELDPAAANGAIAELFVDPGATPGRQLGFYLHAVGPTFGALDPTDDLVISYADDYATAGDRLFVLRGDGTRPAGAGVTRRPFAPGRDVQLDYVTASKITEWASQVTSLEDQNGDGARELVIGAYRAQNGHGQVVIVAGNVVGTAGLARTTDPGVTLTTINTPATVARLGAAIAAHDAVSRADVDGDGREDLFIGGLSGTTGTGFLWFGGAIPRGTTTTDSAPSVVTAPSTISFQRQSPQGFGGQARWIGDINHDGLEDVCWASPFDNTGDGSFEVLWDAR